MYRVIITLTLILSFSAPAIFAQTYTIVPDESEVIINGSSNVHDWESVAEEFSGSASIEVNEGTLVSISDLKFNVVVDGIKSGKGGMDSKTHDALNKKKHPNIVFVLTEITEINEDSLMANGELTISGVTQTISLNVAYEVLADGTVSFKGSKPLKMTNFKVDPPTAMFGAIKAYDDVEVTFDAKFAQ